MYKMIYIVEIHMSAGGHLHEHIEAVRWRHPEGGKSSESTVAAMVEWIEVQKGVAKVTDGVKEVNVLVVRPAAPKKPYLQTVADGRWTNNLLALPRY
jgi:hypothetical protein